MVESELLPTVKYYSDVIGNDVSWYRNDNITVTVPEILSIEVLEANPDQGVKQVWGWKGGERYVVVKEPMVGEAVVQWWVHKIIFLNPTLTMKLILSWTFHTPPLAVLGGWPRRYPPSWDPLLIPTSSRTTSSPTAPLFNMLWTWHWIPSVYPMTLTKTPRPSLPWSTWHCHYIWTTPQTHLDREDCFSASLHSWTRNHFKEEAAKESSVPNPYLPLILKAQRIKDLLTQLCHPFSHSKYDLAPQTGHPLSPPIVPPQALVEKFLLKYLLNYTLKSHLEPIDRYLRPLAQLLLCSTCYKHGTGYPVFTPWL